jgi:hypothetical protein
MATVERPLDAIAEEVERIAEGQRFVTRMIAPANPVTTDENK